MHYGLIGALAILCTLQNSDAIVESQKSIVLDYMDLAPGLTIHRKINTSAHAYATGEFAEGDYLSKIVIRNEDTAATVATLGALVLTSTNTTTGVKMPFLLQAEVNYTITNENPAGSPLTIFYIYITDADTSPVTVLDAMYARQVAGNGTVLVMSSAPYMTLQNFYTGDSANVKLSAAPHDYPLLISFLMAIKKESAGKSKAKLFGPIASLVPEQLDAPFSFNIVLNDGYDSGFKNGARLVFSSPGHSAQKLGNYAHPLINTDIDVTFRSDNGDSKVTTEALFGDVTAAGITELSYGSKTTLGFQVSGNGAEIARCTAYYLAVHWKKADRGFLTAYFESIDDGEITTSTSSSTTPTDATSTNAPEATTSGSSSARLGWLYFLLSAVCTAVLMF